MKNFTVVFGDMAYDKEKDTIECPPTTVNNKKMLPKYRVPMQEGEISVKTGRVKYDKDQNGIIRNVQFINDKETEREEEQDRVG